MLTPMPPDFWDKVIHEVALMILQREASSNGAATIQSTQKIWRSNPPETVTAA